MKITTVLFDLDGTLLPMDQEEFTKAYFKALATKMAPHGYEPQKLIQSVWAGTAAMMKNTSDQNNDTVFWNTLCGIYGETVKEDLPVFDAFYQKEFDQVQESCGYNPKAAEVVKQLQSDGYCVALATNPIFPAIATEKRIRWAGLEPSDFALYTTYENINSCKPNLSYFKEVIARLGVQPEECLMVGNDVGDDMVAQQLGIRVFLLTDCLINKENADLSAYPQGNFDDLLTYIKSL